MAFKDGERSQELLFPESIESYIALDDPVRAYDAFVDHLNFKELELNLNDKQVGNSSYNPVSMLKLLVYGYSYGWRSSRKLERAVKHNISFIWLMGGLAPDHKTISNFRKKNLNVLEKVLKQCARMCYELDLIDGNIFFVDGTKIRANASRSNNYTHKSYKKKLQQVDEEIEKALAEINKIDELEQDEPSLVKMKKELGDKTNLKQAILTAMEKFETIGIKTKNGKERSVNQTDPQSALLSSIHGTHVAYNIQSVVDDKNGLIVSTDACDDSSDVNQFSNQVKKAEEILSKQSLFAVADAGYANTEKLAEIDERGTTVIVPSKRQALHSEESKYSKSHFTYDKDKDCYYCPAGKTLEFSKANSNSSRKKYFFSDPKTCLECPNFGDCTSSQKGRQIVRPYNEDIKQKLEDQYLKPENQKIYRYRKEKVEHPFGHIKHNLGIRNFLVRGRQGALAEFSIGATCFNISRLITILGGVQNLIKTLAS